MKRNWFTYVVIFLCLLGLVNVEVMRAETINPLPRNAENPQTLIWFSDGHSVEFSGQEPYIIHEPCDVFYHMEASWARVRHDPKPRVIVSFRKFKAIRREPMLGMALLGTQRRKMLLHYPPAGTVWHVPAGIAQIAPVLKSDGHHVMQRYGHIIGLEYLLKSQGGKDVEQALGAIRNPGSGVNALYAARKTLEQTSTNIKTPDRFRFERNNVVYLSAHQDGTIHGALQAIRNREHHLWYPYFTEVELPIARDFQPDIYGVSIGDERQLIPGLVLASLVKDALPNCLVVLGGNFWARVIGSFGLPEFAEIFDHCDAIVYREGYIPLRELAATLKPSHASGTAWRKNGEVMVNTATAEPIDFETLPTPEFLNGGADQWAPELVPSLQTMSNCPMGCTFCDISALSDSFLGDPRFMSPRRIAEHMIRIGARKYDIVDELFSIPRQIALGDELRKMGYPATWECYLTITKHLTDPSTCEALYRAGCRSVQLGLESLTPETLFRELKKWNAPPHYGAILKNLKDAGIHTHAFLILGIPGEPLHRGLKWAGFLEEHGDNILTIKSGRYRLSRESPDATRGLHSEFIEVLSDVKPLHLNRDFHYRTISNTKIDALRDILEQACRGHWAYGVTSTIPWWVNRSRYTWDELRQMARSLPSEPDVPHLSDRIAQMRTIVRDEMKRPANFKTFAELAEFARTIA